MEDYDIALRKWAASKLRGGTSWKDVESVTIDCHGDYRYSTWTFESGSMEIYANTKNGAVVLYDLEDEVISFSDLLAEILSQPITDEDRNVGS